MWLNELYRRWTGRTRNNRRLRRIRMRPRQRLTLEALEDRTLLSGGNVLPTQPSSYSVGGMSESGASQFDLSNGGQVSGSAFVGGSVNLSTSIGGISSGFGAKVSLSATGNAGLNLNYLATGGQVQATYGQFALNQSYVAPTQFGQEVNFTPQNTDVNYSTGSFSTTTPSVGAGASLVANISGTVSGKIEAFGASSSGSKNFSTGDINQPIISYSTDNGLEVFGQSVASLFGNSVNINGVPVSASAYVPSVTFPIEIFPPISLNVEVGPNSSYTGLEESVGLGADLGESGSGGGGEVNSTFLTASQTLPSISLASSNINPSGVLSDSGGSAFATMSLQLPAPTTLDVGPFSVTVTPVSFAMTPYLSFEQHGTVTPTNQLTYNFYKDGTNTPMLVDVTEDGVDLGNEYSVTFTPGVDTISLKFAGDPILVKPTWTYGLNYSNEVDLDAGIQGSLTIGQVTGTIQDLGSVTLGPLYQKTWPFSTTKLATVYNNTFNILSSGPQNLPSFVIGANFDPSLKVATTDDNDIPYSPNTPGSGSLRAAIASANLEAQNGTATGTQTIYLGAGTYNLTLGPTGDDDISSGDLNVDSNLIIVGAGNGQTVINAATLGDRIFDVAKGYSLTLKGVTLGLGGGWTTSRSGEAIPNVLGGGAVSNSGTLTLDNCVLENNFASFGGGVNNSGTATIDDCTFIENTGTASGGAIYNSGNLTVSNSTFYDNDASTAAGQTGSTQNGFGGAISNQGTALISNSTLYSNYAYGYGGAIWESRFANTSLTLINDTITDNRANFVGSSPSGPPVGGGIYVNASGRVPLPPVLDNTIVADNYNGATGTTADDIAGPVNTTDSGNNLIGTGGSGGLTKGSNGNMVGITNPGLGTFGNNGGPTETVPLLLGSPAIDAGGNTFVSNFGLSTDQRGASRTVNGTVDIGAVEYQNDLVLTGSLVVPKALGNLTYSYTLTNNGPDPVSGATLTVTLPQGVEFRKLTLPAGWIGINPGIGKSGTVTCTILNLDAGQSATFKILATIQTSSLGSILSTTATVGPTTWDPDPQKSVTLTVTNEQQGQDFKEQAGLTTLTKVQLEHFFDPNFPNAGASEFSAAVSWGDGTTSTITSTASSAGQIVTDPLGGSNVLGSHTYANPGSYTISVVVTDPLKDTFSTTLVQTFPAQRLELYHFTDANNPKATAADFTASVAWGDGSGNFSGDGSGAVTVVADPNGGFDVLGSHTYAATGNNPVAVSVTGLDGTTYSNGNATQKYSRVNLLHFTPTASGLTCTDFIATVNWGDGITTGIFGTSSGAGQIVADPNGGFDVLGSRTYAREGNYTVSVSVQTVPTIKPGEQFTGTVSLNTSTSVNLNLLHFTDATPGATAGDLTATVNWGDGTTSTISGAGADGEINPNGIAGFDVIGNHTYAKAGTYTVTVTITGPGANDLEQTLTLIAATNIAATDAQQVIIARRPPLAIILPKFPPNLTSIEKVDLYNYIKQYNSSNGT